MSHDAWHSWLVSKRPMYFEKRPIYTWLMTILNGIKETYLFWKETYLFWQRPLYTWRMIFLTVINSCLMYNGRLRLKQASRETWVISHHISLAIKRPRTRSCRRALYRFIASLVTHMRHDMTHMRHGSKEMSVVFVYSSCIIHCICRTYAYIIYAHIL